MMIVSSNNVETTIEEIYQYYQPMNHPRIRRPCMIISSFLFMAEAEVTELETFPAFQSPSSVCECLRNITRVCVKSSCVDRKAYTVHGKKGWISLGSLSKTCTRKAPLGACYGAYLWPWEGGGMESGTKSQFAERDAFCT